MPAHTSHTHTLSHSFLWELGLSRKGDGQEQKLGYGGLLLPPTTRTQDAHTCTKGWGWACIPSLGDEETVQETLGRRSGACTLIDVGYAQIKNKSQTAPDSCQRLLVVYAKHMG